MKRVIFFFLIVMFMGLTSVAAQEMNEQQQRAETELKNGNTTAARFWYIRAYENYAKKGQLKQGVECGTKATALYYNEQLYKEAFDLLRAIDQSILSAELDAVHTSALRYYTAKERMQMYVKMHRSPNAKEQMGIMENHVAIAGDEALKNDLLYNKAILYYTFGENAKGNAVFQEMASKLTNQKEYDKVDEVYQTLISNGRKSGSANLVAQSYKNYMAWKDSVNAIKTADEIEGLKQQIADHEASIEEKDSKLATRWAFIIGLCVIVAALAVAIVLGAIVLLRFMMLTRKQKKTIKQAQDNIALKAKFISNISAQLEPTLTKLDQQNSEVKALITFTQHIQTLSELESSSNQVEFEEVQVQSFCEELMNQVRDKVQSDVVLTVNAPKMSALINKEYVSHIVLHLLNNAAEFTPAGGHIRLEFKKRGVHTQQFLISDTGCGISEEHREHVFKPFMEIHELTNGDGLGLPICRQMALCMNGDLDIDSEYTKGTRFILELHT